MDDDELEFGLKEVDERDEDEKRASMVERNEWSRLAATEKDSGILRSMDSTRTRTGSTSMPSADECEVVDAAGPASAAGSRESWRRTRADQSWSDSCRDVARWASSCSRRSQ